MESNRPAIHLEFNGMLGQSLIHLIGEFLQ
jgi:hypothetical protein